MIWSWIKRYSTQKENYPPIYLGFGEDDFVASKGPALLAKSLPTERAFSMPGGHTNRTFKKVFNAHLDRLDVILRGKSERPSSSAAKEFRTDVKR